MLANQIVRPSLQVMKKYKKLIGYTLFFLGAFILFWVLLFAGTDNWKSKLPKLNTVKPFTFTNQDNQPFTLADMKGKVCVVNYFFTTCQGICPKMNHNMDEIYEQFKDDPDFMIVSHTCMPEVDSATVLKHYADSIGVNDRKWVFLTGRKDSLYYQARNSYLVDDNKNPVESIDDQFIHTQFFALIDKDGNVRGEIFDGLKQKDLDKLKEDIKLLLKERAGGSNNFSNNIFGNSM